MKKNLIFPLSILLILAMVFSLAGCAPPAEEPVDENDEEVADGPQFIVVSAGSPGGVYFPLGAGIAKVITDKVDNVIAQSETTAASVENCRLVGGGESEMGMAMANVAYDAWAGEGDFEGDDQPIQALFSMYPAQQHLIVLEDSDIHSVDDLAGNTVSVDAPGSGAEVTSHIIMDAAGITDEVDAVNYSQPEAAEALKDGLVDAVFYNFASPAAVVEEIKATHEVRFIPLEESLMDDIIEDYPYFTMGVIPEGHYGLEEDVAALSVGNLMVVHEDMSEDMAYDLLSAIFEEESVEELIGIHWIAENFQPDLASESPIPLHPGAERFFDEVL